jgi:hypothetical protein
MTLDNQINFIIKTMKNSGYKVNKMWAINYIQIKEDNPNLSKDELIKQTFEETLFFYEENLENEDFTEELFSQTVSIPISLIEEVKNKDGIEKTRCFLEYFYDLYTGISKDYFFYAKSWKVSKNIAIKWLFEFNKYLENRFHNSIAM